MKKIFFYLTLMITSLAFTACDDDQTPPNGYIAQTETGSQTMVLLGYTGSQDGYNVLQPDPFKHPAYVSRPIEGAPQFTGAYYNFMLTTYERLSDMKEVPNYDSEAWRGAYDIMAGKCYWVKYYDTTVFRFMKIRVAYIDGNKVGIEYIVTDETQDRPNENVNANYDSTISAAYELEIPHLNATNYFAAHYVDYNGERIMNLAVEWNSTLKHSSWVAFSFDSTTSQDNISRGDNWQWDPLIPTDKGAVYESNHKSDGYDKGHLCASEDRVYCKDANDQTFFYSNISPQMGSFNQQFWAKFESLVQKWGRSTQQKTYDKLYVTKGGTLHNLLTSFTGTKKANDGVIPTSDSKGLSKGGLAVPAYYYMALLAEKDGKYQAIAFLIPHNESLSYQPTTAQMQSYTCSIDYLEEQTGIDFFCNLRDNIENEVEASFNLNDWKW